LGSSIKDERETYFEARIEAISLRGTTSRSRLSHSSTPSSSSRRGTSASHFLTSSLPLREPPLPPPLLPTPPTRWTTEDDPVREADHEPVEEASELRRADALPAEEPRRRIGLGSVIIDDAVEPGGPSARDEVEDWRDGCGR
jgi:hypothetical protein